MHATLARPACTGRRASRPFFFLHMIDCVRNDLPRDMPTRFPTMNSWSSPSLSVLLSLPSHSNHPPPFPPPTLVLKFPFNPSTTQTPSPYVTQVLPRGLGYAFSPLPGRLNAAVVSLFQALQNWNQPARNGVWSQCAHCLPFQPLFEFPLLLSSIVRF